MTLAEIRQNIPVTKILEILSKYGVSPCVEAENYIIFPTCCHNVYGGSAKLYYYKNSTLFRCYTECNSSFDIFELLIKMEKLRGREITLFQALQIAGVNPNELQTFDSDDEFQRTLEYMYQFSNAVYKTENLKPIEEIVLNASVFNTDVLSLWEQEGISLSTMKKYKIGYDPIDNCITIPIFDDKGKLVSVRGRFLSEEETVKYKPIVYCNKVLSAPSSQILYGLWQNKDAIKKSKTAVIFESEKSVLMMDTYYKSKNNAVATLGKNISNQHILMLKQLGVENVILAYDADYITEEETKKKFKEYRKIGKVLAPFFNTDIIIDWYHKLPYKASPIDCGKEIFEFLLEKRYNVKF